MVQHAMLSITDSANMETLLAAGALNLLFALLQGEVETDWLARWHGCSAPRLSDLLGDPLVRPKLSLAYSFDCIGLEAVKPFFVSLGWCRAGWFTSGRWLCRSWFLDLLLRRCRKQCEAHPSSLVSRTGCEISVGPSCFEPE